MDLFTLYSNMYRSWKTIFSCWEVLLLRFVGLIRWNAKRLRSAMSIGATDRSVVFIVPTTYTFSGTKSFPFADGKGNRLDMDRSQHSSLLFHVARFDRSMAVSKSPKTLGMLQRLIFIEQYEIIFRWVLALPCLQTLRKKPSATVKFEVGRSSPVSEPTGW